MREFGDGDLEWEEEFGLGNGRSGGDGDFGGGHDHVGHGETLRPSTFLQWTFFFNGVWVLWVCVSGINVGEVGLSNLILRHTFRYEQGDCHSPTRDIRVDDHFLSVQISDN